MIISFNVLLCRQVNGRNMNVPSFCFRSDKKIHRLSLLYSGAYQDILDQALFLEQIQERSAACLL